MAISKKEDGSISITNGDLEALKKITEQYGVKDETDVIAFAIGVLSQSNGQGVTIRREDGVAVKLIPSDDIRKS